MTRPSYEPTPDQVANATRKIREQWTQEQEQKRNTTATHDLTAQRTKAHTQEPQ